jgi:hypothetical protein
MWRREGSNGLAEFCNDEGCPYVNQTLTEALQDWSQVLASVDLRSLPGDLQAELGQLRHKYADMALSAPAR